jgi:hypothetical protein
LIDGTWETWARSHNWHPRAGGHWIRAYVIPALYAYAKQHWRRTASLPEGWHDVQVPTAIYTPDGKEKRLGMVFFTAARDAKATDREAG